MCVQPLLACRSREGEDLIRDKSDPKDAVLISWRAAAAVVLDRCAGDLARVRIAGLTPVGAAAILAETGDPARFATARALARHAGLCPRDNASGAFQGKTPISGRGRPALRLAAWRAVRAALPNNR